jgi:hypothetical protein
MSVTIKTRRAALFHERNGGLTIALEFCWMCDDSLVASAKFLRTSQDPAVATTSLERAEYAFFPRVRKQALPDSPCRVITVRKVAPVRKKRRLENATRRHEPCKFSVLADIMALERESEVRATFMKTRNGAPPGLPPKWEAIVFNWQMPILELFQNGTKRQVVMLQHLVVARIAQSGTLLSSSNRSLSTSWGCTASNYGCLQQCSPSYVPERFDLDGSDANSSSDLEFHGSDDELIDAPFIGNEPPAVRDFHLTTSEVRSPTPCGALTDFEMVNDILPLAWCSECQNYTSLSRKLVQSSDWDPSQLMRPRCADCGVGFSMRAILSRHFREVDILASCCKNDNGCRMRVRPVNAPMHKQLDRNDSAPVAIELSSRREAFRIRDSNGSAY